MEDRTMAEAQNKIVVGGEGSQYVTFCLGEEEYGVDILKVQEIIGITPVTKVPYLPDFIKGVINLRGIVVPIVDLRLRFRLPVAEYTDRTCVVIVKVDERVVGMIVDSVSEVMEISEAMIDPAPAFGHGVRTDFIEGMGKVEERLVLLLNIEKLFTEDEMQDIGNVSGGDAGAAGVPEASEVIKEQEAEIDGAGVSASGEAGVEVETQEAVQ
jgi:purine-binding chemotaxis protein CheW